MSGTLPTREEIADIITSYTSAWTTPLGHAESLPMADALLARLRTAWELMEQEKARYAEQARNMEIKWAHTNIDLRACAEALTDIHRIVTGAFAVVHTVADEEAISTIATSARAALARPGVRDALR